MKLKFPTVRAEFYIWPLENNSKTFFLLSSKPSTGDRKMPKIIYLLIAMSDHKRHIL
jgi:hypothetical protein